MFTSSHFLFCAHFLSLAVSPAHFFIQPKHFLLSLSHFFILHTFYPQLSLPHTFLSAHFLFSAHFLSLAVSPAQFSIRPKLFLLSLSHFFVRQIFFVLVVTLFILRTLLSLAVSPAHFFIRPKLFLLSLSPFFVRQNFFVFVVTLFILPTLLILSCLSRTLFYPTKLFVRVVTLFILLAVSHAHFLS